MLLRRWDPWRQAVPLKPSAARCMDLTALYGTDAYSGAEKQPGSLLFRNIVKEYVPAATIESSGRFHFLSYGGACANFPRS